MNRAEILSYIKNKNIILFGAGNRAQKFYQDFCEQLKICYCISNSPVEEVFCVNKETICEVKRVEQLEVDSNKFIILCSSESVAMQNQLSDMGLILGENYLDSEIYRILAEDKKIALFYGICHIRAISECLKYSKEFSERYNFFYYLDYINYNFIEQSLMYLLIESCDLFIYSAYFSFEPLRRIDAFFLRLKPKCKKISIPLITFNGFYPRIRGKALDSNPYCIISSKSPYATFSNYDENINNLIDSQKNVDEILKIVSDINYFQKDFLIKNLEKEWHRMRMSEKFADIKISGFIEDNYKKSRLFLNETHISNVTLIEISKRIMSLLDLPIKIDVEKIQQRAPFLYTSEVPLYPSIIYHLNLEQYHEHSLYKLFTHKGIREVSFEQYVTMYLEFCSNIKKYIELGYVPS